MNTPITVTDEHNSHITRINADNDMIHHLVTINNILMKSRLERRIENKWALNIVCVIWSTTAATRATNKSHHDSIEVERAVRKLLLCSFVSHFQIDRILTFCSDFVVERPKFLNVPLIKTCSQVNRVIWKGNYIYYILEGVLYNNLCNGNEVSTNVLRL